MQVDETEIVVRTNFDELDATNCCWVSLRFLRGPRRPREGEWIQLRDERGAACMRSSGRYFRPSPLAREPRPRAPQEHVTRDVPA
jgi:hypothetical protein